MKAPTVLATRSARLTSALLLRPFLALLLTALLLVSTLAQTALAAVGCDLNDPVRDVPRLFKDSTSFKTRYVSIRQQGGEALLRRIEGRLGQKYLPLYAPVDVPYTIYEIYNGTRKVGYIHGVNQKGQFGGIQVFMAQDLNGRIKSFYIQKMTGQSAAKLRDARFGRNFVGVTIRDFDSFDPATGKGSGRIAEIRNPAPETETDFYGVLRGLKKNMVLMEEFIFSGNGGRP
jgi:hypothetical protein